MSQKKLNQAHILARLVEDESFTNAEAAAAMGLSKRHVIRLKGEYKKHGDDALVHKNIGRPPLHAKPEELIQRIIELKRTGPFEKANFLHFKEILNRKEYGISISYSSLHQILTTAGIRSTNRRRPPKKHRRRKRKAREGIMLQMDASPFDWLDNGQLYSLHGAIDDATGKVVALHICKNECLQGYFEVMRAVVTNNGIPLSLYADRHAIFVSPKDSKMTIEEELKGVQVKDTQFGRAVKQLGITLIKARSPQAKGRIERLWETLQSRLPVEFALAGIAAVDAANAFLAKYIQEYNEVFAVDPEDSVSAYRPLSPAINIENILCVAEKRIFDNGGVFSFHNRSYILVPTNKDRLLPSKGNIDVLVSPAFGIRAAFMGVIYEIVPYVKPEKQSLQPSQKKKGRFIPPDSHYFKYGHNLIKKITFEDNDLAILKMLERIFLGKLDDAG